MTAQSEMTAGGEAVVTDSSQPATDPIEALADSFFDEEEEQSDASGEAEAGDGDGLSADDIEDEPDTPAIKPPVSWTDEEKAHFAELPREVQETLSRRESEREKFVQSKASEAASARASAEREAVAKVGEIAQQHAAMFQTLLPQVPAEPDPMLQVDDPIAYAEQQRYRQHVLAQHQAVQQAIQGAQQQARQAEQFLAAQAQEEFHSVLRDKFPEFLDPATGPKLREQLGSTALALGFPAEVLADVNATEVLAMKTATDWKAKADKYDALMSQKMEKVRAAKGLPPVARPGTAPTRAQAGRKAVDAAFEQAKASKGRAREDAFGDYLSKAGFL